MTARASFAARAAEQTAGESGVRSQTHRATQVFSCVSSRIAPFLRLFLKQSLRRGISKAVLYGPGLECYMVCAVTGSAHTITCMNVKFCEIIHVSPAALANFMRFQSLFWLGKFHHEFHEIDVHAN